MPEHTQYDDEGLFNPETHHEQSDVPMRPLWWAIVIFIVFAILTHIVIGFFYKGLARAERNRMEPPQSEIARPASADVPQNQPLLQPFPRKDAANEVSGAIAPQTDTPVVDLQKMRQAEVQVLTNYGWVDKQQGIVHIPIDQAKEMLAAQLAVQGQAGMNAAPAATTTSATATATAPAGAESAVPANTATAPANTHTDGARP